ncbi:MAG: hypothetical protein KDB94_02750, partial [Acidobacteria bacterium]|nr:hypothetical protein [Acidobacteriota bacterium]
MTRASSASTSIARAPAATARIAALALFLSVAGAPLAARDGWSERTWRVEDELPIAAVTAIDQTPDGYLWLATRNGLVRFDGARFEVLRGTDHLEMPSDRLTTLFTEPSGDLWTTTQSEDLLRLRHGTFRRFDREAGLPDDRVVFWRRGRGGELWLGTRGGAAHCLGDRCRDPTDGRVRDPVLALEPADDGSLWIGTHERGLLRLLPDGTLETFGGDRGLPALDVEALHITADGTLWVGTGRGLARLEGGRLIPATVPGEPNTELVLRLESDRDGNLYAGTASGLFVHHGGRLERRTRYPSYTGAERLVLDTPAGRAVNLGTRVEVDGREIFSSAHPITSLHFDREGTLWVGSDGGGLTRLRPTPITLVGEAEGLPGDNVYPIVEGPPGTLWFGVLGGLARLEGGEMRSWGVEAGLPHFGVWSIAPDGAESAWVGSNGVRRFESGRFTKRGVDPALLDIDVRALLLDRQGALWVGSSGRGLFRRLDGEWRRWTADEGVPPAAIRVLAEDAEGAIWLGTDGAGIARCRADAGCERLSSADGLPSDLVRALWIEESGAVWVGTENRGLVRIEPGDGPLAAARRTFVRRHDGLFDDGIHQIVDDGLGRLWMSTNRGLFWVARAELEAFVAGTLGEVHSVVYTERDGLRSREANGGVQSAGLRASDGRLWFPTQAGAAVIDPRRVRDYLKPPPVVFERIEARSPDGVRTLPPPTPEDGVGRLELRPGERDLTVAYTAPSFVAPERIRFRYRLEGLSSDWTDVGDVRQIALSYLPPGRHRLRVAAANADGVWNLDGAVLDLVLPARFWETRAFPVSLVALALAALGAAGLWRRRVTRLRQRELERRVREQTAELALEKERVEAQAEQLRELDRAKSHFFANVSHELRTPL